MNLLCMLPGCFWSWLAITTSTADDVSRWANIKMHKYLANKAIKYGMAEALYTHRMHLSYSTPHGIPAEPRRVRTLDR
jgi:hypothetical protein